jgi:hypothetical protein
MPFTHNPFEEFDNKMYSPLKIKSSIDKNNSLLDLHSDLLVKIGYMAPQSKLVNKMFYQLIPSIDKTLYTYPTLDDNTIINYKEFNICVKEKPYEMLKHLINKSQYRSLKCNAINSTNELWPYCEKIINNQILLCKVLKEWHIFKDTYNSHIKSKSFHKMEWNESFVTSLIMHLYH